MENPNSDMPETPADSSAQQPVRLPDAKPVQDRPNDVIVISQSTIYYFVIAILFFVAGFVVAWVTFTARAEDIKSIAVSAAREAVQSALANGGSGQAAAAPTEIPRQEVTIRDTDPSWGPANAKVTIVEFSDFQCPYCEMFFQRTYPLLQKNYGDKVRFVFRNYPISGLHPDADRAAYAAACAKEQNKFWEYHDVLFKNQNDLSRDALIKYASQANITDSKQFTDCLDKEKYK